MILCLTNARSGDLHFGIPFVALRALVREIIPNREGWGKLVACCRKRYRYLKIEETFFHPLSAGVAIILFSWDVNWK